MPEPITFAHVNWIKPLAKALGKIRKQRADEITRLGDLFGDPVALARYYVEPRVQHHNPADLDEDQVGARSHLSTPALEAIDGFLGGDFILGGGKNQMFMLSDAGMGKTSFLMMLKLWHLTSFWPRGYECVLLKLGNDTLDTIDKIDGQAKTMLLLDALDEDPTAWADIKARLVALLQATENFRRVLISCRTQFFPEGGVDPFSQSGRVEVGGYVCPMYFLSPFDDGQVDAFLHKRFPDPLHSFISGRIHPSRRQAEPIVKAMSSLRFRPLLLTHIEDLLDGDLDWNKYSIYHALVSNWLLREERKLAKQGFARAPKKEDLWEVCAAVAVEMQQASTRTLSETALNDRVSDFPALKHLEHFEFGGRSLLNRTSDGSYRFAHYSIQEFLVAYQIAQGTLRDRYSLKITTEMCDFLSQSSETGISIDLLRPHDLSGVEDKLTGFGFSDTLQAGGTGPEMVLLSPGTFTMGSPVEETDRLDWEGPQRRVSFTEIFAIGRYAVTFEEFDVFCAATKGRVPPEDQGWGRGKRPVINVSWDDAQAYVEWLSQQTGKRYRLPSEAEWEYAARGGTQSDYWWGKEPGRNRANFQGSGSEWSGKQTAPVDAFEPNRVGLYQMLGNVYEWVQDAWHDSYEGAPCDGSAWESGVGDSRVLRGGSWLFHRDDARCASRIYYHPHVRNYSIGFRVVCSSPIR